MRCSGERKTRARFSGVWEIAPSWLIRLTISSPSHDRTVAPLAVSGLAHAVPVARLNRRFSMGGRAF